MNTFEYLIEDNVKVKFNRNEWLLSESVFSTDSNWLSFTYKKKKIPNHGYKIHISSSIISAQEIINIVLPILNQEKAHFKVVVNIIELQNMLNGKYGATQVGKFITVYPYNDEHFLKLSRLLDSATNFFDCPIIPYEKRYNSKSIIYYRYGGFSREKMQLNTGEIVPALRYNGIFYHDKRDEEFEKKLGINNPLLKDINNDKNVIKDSRDIIKGRFAVMDILSKSPKGNVSIGIDLQDEKFSKVIIKEGKKGLMIDNSKMDAKDRIIHEVQMLRKISKFKFYPQYVASYVEDDLSILIYEYKEGITLGNVIRNISAEFQLITEKVSIDWMKKIALLIKHLHDMDIVFADLKPDNILIDTKGGFHLIDFEVSHLSNTSFSIGLGTEGYSPKQQLSGERSANFQDDIYSLGAVFLSLLTLTNLSLFGQDFDCERILKCEGVFFSTSIKRFIKKCLNIKDEEQFTSINECQDFHFNLDVRIQNNLEKFNSQQLIKNRFLEQAIQIGDKLLGTSINTEKGSYWITTHKINQNEICRDIYLGVSGIGIFLVNLFKVTQDKKYLEKAVKCGEWLINTPDKIGREKQLPGLYFGESGVGLFFLSLWKSTRNEKHLKYAINRSDVVNDNNEFSPDLLTGAAGIGLFNVSLFDLTNDLTFKNRVEKYAQYFLQFYKKKTTKDIFWKIPDEHDKLSGKQYFGLAHGSAGIAFFLTKAYVLTGNHKFLDLSINIANWLLSIVKVGYAENDTCYNWESEPNSNNFMIAWCHGATGIGNFYLKIYKVTSNKTFLDTAINCGNTIYHYGKFAGTTICHGLAGNINFLLALFSATDDITWQKKANYLSSILNIYKIENENSFFWPSEKYDITTPGFMIGESGIGDCFLKLHQPKRTNLIDLN